MKDEINLYVDDLWDCPEGFVIARNIEEAKEYFKNNKIKILSLDHDLGIDEQGNLLATGYDLVKYICENGLSAEKIFLHTDNSVGRIKQSICLDLDDVVKWCSDKILDTKAIIFRRGKNWYIDIENCEITVNAHSYTIITAHKIKI